MRCCFMCDTLLDELETVECGICSVGVGGRWVPFSLFLSGDNAFVLFVPDEVVGALCCFDEESGESEQCLQMKDHRGVLRSCAATAAALR